MKFNEALELSAKFGCRFKPAAWMELCCSLSNNAVLVRKIFSNERLHTLYVDARLMLDDWQVELTGVEDHPDLPGKWESSGAEASAFFLTQIAGKQE